MPMIDIFEFWSQIKSGEHIHPADRNVFDRISPIKHGFQLGCLPECYAGRLRTAPVILLYVSPGFEENDLVRANTEEGRQSHILRLTGHKPMSGHRWFRERTSCFGDWDTIRNNVAVLNIGAYHSKTVLSYAYLLALPSSRACLDWAQHVLFPEAEASKRIVICMRSAAYWGLELGRQYRGTLFAPAVTRSGHLKKASERDRIIELVKERLLNTPCPPSISVDD
jgi:hypothetical protein